MKTLAVDIGGTNFQLALFDDDRIIRRATRPTDREGARDWMLEQVVSTAKEWRREVPFERCGIGFGGPVNFADQRVAFSTHVGGWNDFPLARHFEQELGRARHHGQRRQCRRAGRSRIRRRPRLLAAVLHDDLDRHRRRHLRNGEIWRGADSFGGEIGHLSIRPDGPECLCHARGCLERMCSGLWLERDYGKTAKELLQDPEFVKRYVVDLALGLKACIMLLNPARIVIGGGISKAGDALFVPLRAELGRQITDWSGARIDVAPAALGGDSVLYGALALARKFLKS